MKLAFIKKKFSIHGGAERYLQTFLENLQKKGYDIHVLANRWEPCDGLTFHKIRANHGLSVLSVFSFNRNIRKKLKTELNVDAVISFERTNCQDIYRAGDGVHAEWLSIRSRSESALKKFSSQINPLHRYLLHLEKKLFQNTSILIANSNMVREQIISHYKIPPEKIRVIYNGVDLNRFCPGNREAWRSSTRQMLKLDAEEKVALFVGSGFQRKGLAVLLETFGLIADKKMKLLIVGRGKKELYGGVVARHGLKERVFFLEPRKDIEKLYAAADLFILPTFYDPFSNATLEAMASGLPVITTRNNGVSELIRNGEEGFVVEDFLDSRELSEKILQVFREHISMGDKARRKAEEFPIERAIRQFSDTLTSFVEKNKNEFPDMTGGKSE